MAAKCPNPNCEYFNRTLPNNAKVCPMCGTALGNVVVSTPTPPRPSAPAPQASQVVNRPTYQPPAAPSAYQAAAASAPPAPAPPVYPVSPSPAHPSLRLIHTSGREFRLPGEEGYIGRRSPTSGKMPDIDLTGIPDEGVVSRSHARIYWDWNQNAYMLVDNNSRNGTSLNGTPLSPGVHYRLSHADSLQLGQHHLVSFRVSLT